MSIPKSSNFSSELIVKLRTTDKVRSAMSHLLDRDTKASPLKSLLEGSKVKKLFEPAEPVRGARALLGTVGSTEDPVESSLLVVTMAGPEEAEKSRKKLESDDSVEYAHVPIERFAAAARKGSVPATLLSRQWGLAAVRLLEASSSAGFKEAKDIPIGVIDSGVDENHPDLKGVIDRYEHFSRSKKDTSGHGTHVTGILAARASNGFGVRGLCQSQKIMVFKALDPYAGAGYYRALRRAGELGARVINMSLGGGHDPTEELVIRSLIKQGILVVAAMGNEYLAGNPTSYPAALDGVIAVAALDEVDRRADFSNTGPHVWIAAPGERILSTVPTWPTPTGGGKTGYASADGTSMATPFVTAAVALCLARKPGATAKQVRDALKKGAARLPGQKKFNQEVGHGRLDLLGTLAAL